MRTLALILAAGKGTRIRSAQAKVLQPVGGKAMIVHLLETLQELTLERTAVVFGYQGEQLRTCIEPAWPQVQWIAQTEQRGTGHAVQMAMAEIADRAGADSFRRYTAGACVNITALAGCVAGKRFRPAFCCGG